MNAGKRFEEDIKKSIPSYVLYHRLKDSTGTFGGGNNLRFSSKQPCDVFLWNGEIGKFFTLELKTTKSNAFSFEDIESENEQQSKMIHKHQILALKEYACYKGVISGFVLNFRLEKENVEHTYFLSIKNFLRMIDKLGKKSFNEKDLLHYSPILIEGTKKRTRWTWDMEKFMNSIGNNIREED